MMYGIRKRLVSVIFAMVCLMGTFSSVPVYAQETALTDEQRNAIGMLNYITVLTQDINASKNSRMYMEEAYSTLINNTYTNAVDRV
jgi:LPS O-antigen subunit length determinant protein (WzzB/FepE family)